MNENFTDEQNMKIAQREYHNYRVGNSVRIDNYNKTIGYVSDKIDDPFTGSQVYAVTNIKNAQQHPNQVKNVTVIYRGSTSPTAVHDWHSGGDAFADWTFNDIPMAAHIKTGIVSPIVAPQLNYSSHTFNRLLAKYPKATFNSYGHSLGSMNGVYALANMPKNDIKRIGQAHFYEGPNIYNQLTPSQKVTLDKLKDRAFVYADKNDLVALNYEKGNHTGLTLIKIKSKYLGVVNAIKQHMWGGYQFKNGVLLTEHESASLTLKMNRISIAFKKYFGGSGSGSEKIYLDAADALATAVAMQRIVDHKVPELIKMEQERMKMAKSFWKNTYNAVAHQAPDLNHSEIMECLHAGGFYRGEVVDKTVHEAEQAIAKFKHYQSSFDELVSEFKQSVNKMVADDQELSQIFKEVVN